MTVQSVVRAFDILKRVAARPAGAGVSTIARETDLHKSTVSRLLATLESVEAVERVSTTTDFRISPALLTHLTPATFRENLIEIARPHLLWLHAAVGEDVGLAMPEGHLVAYIDQVSSDRAVQVKDWTGERFPLHTVSAGKVMLAFQTRDFVEGYLSRPLVAYTTRTLATPDALREALAIAREQQIDWSFGEFDDALNAAAAPVFDRSGRVVAAVNIYGPEFRFPGAADQAKISAQLREAAARLTERLAEQLP